MASGGSTADPLPQIDDADLLLARPLSSSGIEAVRVHGQRSGAHHAALERARKQIVHHPSVFAADGHQALSDSTFVVVSPPTSDHTVTPPPTPIDLSVQLKVAPSRRTVPPPVPVPPPAPTRPSSNHTVPVPVPPPVRVSTPPAPDLIDTSSLISPEDPNSTRTSRVPKDTTVSSPEVESVPETALTAEPSLTPTVTPERTPISESEVKSASPTQQAMDSPPPPSEVATTPATSDNDSQSAREDIGEDNSTHDGSEDSGDHELVPKPEPEPEQQPEPVPVPEQVQVQEPEPETMSKSKSKTKTKTKKMKKSKKSKKMNKSKKSKKKAKKRVRAAAASAASAAAAAAAAAAAVSTSEDTTKSSSENEETVGTKRRRKETESSEPDHTETPEKATKKKKPKASKKKKKKRKTSATTSAPGDTAEKSSWASLLESDDDDAVALAMSGMTPADQYRMRKRNMKRAKSNKKRRNKYAVDSEASVSGDHSSDEIVDEVVHSSDREFIAKSGSDDVEFNIASADEGEYKKARKTKPRSTKMHKKMSKKQLARASEARTSELRAKQDTTDDFGSIDALFTDDDPSAPDSSSGDEKAGSSNTPTSASASAAAAAAAAAAAVDVDIDVAPEADLGGKAEIVTDADIAIDARGAVLARILATMTALKKKRAFRTVAFTSAQFDFMWECCVDIVGVMLTPVQPTGIYLSDAVTAIYHKNTPLNPSLTIVQRMKEQVDASVDKGIEHKAILHRLRMVSKMLTAVSYRTHQVTIPESDQTYNCAWTNKTLKPGDSVYIFVIYLRQTENKRTGYEYFYVSEFPFALAMSAFFRCLSWGWSFAGAAVTWNLGQFFGPKISKQARMRAFFDLPTNRESLANLICMIISSQHVVNNHMLKLC